MFFPIFLSAQNKKPETKNLSFIGMSPTRVIEVCSKTIDHIKVVREKKKKAYIEAEQTKLNNRRWFKRAVRWFPDRFKLYTYESTVEYIEKWMKKSDLRSVLRMYYTDYFSTYGDGSMGVATKLLALAKEADREGVQVMVTAKDWDWIK